MATSVSFTTANTVVVVNGRRITDWGDTDNPIIEEPIDAKRTLKRCVGGNAYVLERINPGRRVTLSLNPASADSAFLHGLYLSGAVISYARSQIGSLEKTLGNQGVIINEESINRGGVTAVSDNQFVIEFNDWTSMRGGEL